MKKILIVSSLLISTFLVSCGSSSDNSNTLSEEIITGQGFYLDSAVEGVTYHCGNQTGITNQKGLFIFEKGKDCQFYVGEIPLKTLAAASLKDGANVIEDNVTIASFLQTLDNDGDATNGIQITTQTIEALKQEGITSVPQTEAELTDVWSGLKNTTSLYKGRIVDTNEASVHLAATNAAEINKNGHGNQSGHNDNGELLAYFGDKEQNRIVVVDANKMEIVDEIFTNHEKSYAAEVIKTRATHGNKRPKMYIDNRGSDVIDVLDSSSNKIIKSIPLAFHPRSINVNEDTGLVVVSGVDKAMIAVIDSKTDEVIATVGDNKVTYPTNSGHSYISSGTLASGHPEWLNDTHFVLLDRQNLKISTYKITKNTAGEWLPTLVNTIDTPSPIHNLIPPKINGKAGNRNNTNIQRKHSNGNGGTHGQGGHEMRYSSIFYATAEGATNVYPSVLKLEFTEDKGLQIIDELQIKKADVSPNIMGVHHLNFMHNQKYIYVGSDEGNLFIVNYETEPMQIEKIIPAGKGAGHTDEMKHGGNIAVVINHKDKFITLINSSTNEKIADIEVSNTADELLGVVQTQSHPKYHFSQDGRYFYLFLTEDGAMVKVDLIEKKVIDRLEIGGKLAMGSFLGH